MIVDLAIEGVLVKRIANEALQKAKQNKLQTELMLMLMAVGNLTRYGY